MDLRTIINPEQSGDRISHQTSVLFIGSCFASEIGHRAEEGKIPALINPYGTLFNPASVSDALVRFAEKYFYSKEDLYCYKERFYSLSHYTAFSSGDQEELVGRLNMVNSFASEFLKNASFLFITFGTAWIYELKENGKSVANCHKLPSSLFSHRQMGTDEIVGKWQRTLNIIRKVNPLVKVWLTVSPVRHLNDGLHANQLSKASLLLACEQLLHHPSVAGYFPSYEIFMDDLRDYRYYAQDMLHPSETGIQYVWGKFTDAFFNESTMRLWSEAEKITRSTHHRIVVQNKETRQFADTMLNKIKLLQKEAPYIDFNTEKEYFNSLK